MKWRNELTLLAQRQFDGSTGVPAAVDGTVPASSGTGWSDVLLAGGWPGALVLLTLIALSLATVYLAIDAALTLRAGDVSSVELTEAVRAGLTARNLAEAEEACRCRPSVQAMAIRAGLAEIDMGYAAVERASEDVLIQQIGRWARRVDYLAVIGNLAPMVGLLGTVMGMVVAFRQVATTAGNAGAPDLAEGIYQALITTVGGLVVAIPAIGIHALARTRMDSLMADCASRTTQALAPLKRLTRSNASSK